MSLWFQYCVPHRPFNRLAGYLASHQWPYLKNQLIDYFIKRHPVNMSEAQEPDPFAYPSFNAFFTRALKSEVRPMDADISAWVSPADGAISAFGQIAQDQLLQAKGHSYSLKALLGVEEDNAGHAKEKADNATEIEGISNDFHHWEQFQNGDFITVYLAPHDYHRVHMPMAGILKRMTYVPGCLFSVNTKTAARIPNLFARNERLIAEFQTDQGPLLLILVGAMIVGNIETVWSGTVLPHRHGDIRRITYNNPHFFQKGEEMGRFLLGSTVIAIMPPNCVRWRDGLEEGQSVKMAETLGTLVSD